MKTKYVVGFLFNSNATQVVLIKKNRPSYLKGKWNGVGGHIEENETPQQAMRREFKEETGVDHVGFRQVCIIEYPECVLHFFVAFNTEAALATFNATDEAVERFNVDQLVAMPTPECFVQTWWLVPMLLDLYRRPQLLSLTTVLNVDTVTP